MRPYFKWQLRRDKSLSLSEKDKRIYNFLENIETSEIITEKADYAKVHVTEFTLDDDRQVVLFEHPNSEVIFKDIYINENAKLKFGIGINQTAWDKTGDGVLFEIIIVDEKSQNNQIFSQYIDPKNYVEDRKWFNNNFDLKAFVGQTVSFTFKTTSGPDKNINYDWAGWAQPQILW